MLKRKSPEGSLEICRNQKYNAMTHTYYIVFCCVFRRILAAFSSKDKLNDWKAEFDQEVIDEMEIIEYETPKLFEDGELIFVSIMFSDEEDERSYWSTLTMEFAPDDEIERSTEIENQEFMRYFSAMPMENGKMPDFNDLRDDFEDENEFYHASLTLDVGPDVIQDTQVYPAPEGFQDLPIRTKLYILVNPEQDPLIRGTYISKEKAMSIISGHQEPKPILREYEYTGILPATVMVYIANTTFIDHEVVYIEDIEGLNESPDKEAITFFKEQFNDLIGDDKNYTKDLQTVYWELYNVQYDPRWDICNIDDSPSNE